MSSISNREHGDPVIARVLQGEKEAFYDLIRPCERTVYLTAFSVLKNVADAQDVAQDAVLSAFRHLADFRGESRFATWLVRITLNHARMRLRKQHRHSYRSIDGGIPDEEREYLPGEFVDSRESPSEALERTELREILARALQSLSETDREVVVLRDVQELSIAETAEILGVREGAVKSRLMRARLRLRPLVAPFTTARGLFNPNLSEGLKRRQCSCQKIRLDTVENSTDWHLGKVQHAVWK
jgi:RNA polymerase sigma-70 factor (ECF subfamily)